MAEDWKQVWHDMRAALLGNAPEPEIAEPDASVELDAPIVELVIEAVLDADVPETAVLPTDNTFLEQPVEAITSLPIIPTWQRLLRRAPLILAILAGVMWALVSTGVWSRLTAPQPPAPDVVASFDGGQISLTDLETHLDLLTGGHPEEIAHTQDEILLVLEDMVMDGLVQRWAAERQPEGEEAFSHAMQHINEELSLSSIETGLHDGDIPVMESEIQAYYNENRDLFGDQPLTAVREQIRQTLVAGQEQDYVTEYIQQLREIASINRYFDLLNVPTPTDDDLRRYYEENRAQFTLPRRTVVDELQFPIGEDETAARQDADDALLKLRSGAAFADIPQEIPRVLLATGETVIEGIRETAWDTAVFAMTDGELSGVFRAGDTFYIVQLQEKQNTRTQTFEEVRILVETAIAPRMMDDWFNANTNKTLFTIKSSRYTVGEFYQEYLELPFTVQAQYAGPEGMKALTEQTIERLLLVADAEDRLLDVENQPLADEARLQVLKQMLHLEEVDDKVEISDEEIQRFYDGNQDLISLPPQARIRYIRIGLGNSADEVEAAQQRVEEAYEKLNPGLFQTGEDFAAIAQTYSEDPDTAANGGELPGWIGGEEDILAQMDRHAFNDIVLSLPPGEISQPFQFGDSLYIVQIIERTEPVVMSLEEARPFIEEILAQQKHEELEADLQEKLLEGANLEIYWPVLDEYLLQFPTPEPLFFPFDPPPAS